MLVQTTGSAGSRHALEFGVYRDGDNNLDDVQAVTLAQAVRVSTADRSIAFSIEDTTSRPGSALPSELHTESYTISDGRVTRPSVEPAHEMSARKNLAQFVARTLDDAERVGARATWVDLVDHGGGDGGGLQTDSSGGRLMREDDIAGAIADGARLHAARHPEDAGRRVDGVVANQCLMATEGFASALSHAGVRYLAASPETMIAPGVPTSVAHDIAANLDDPRAMANAVVDDTMRTRYGAGDGETWGPAAAFDVLDLAPRVIGAMEHAVKRLNTAVADAVGGDHSLRAVVRGDARAVPGMTRFTREAMPWHADRPAIALYTALAGDERLPDALRSAARQAADAVSAMMLAHRESRAFAPFNDASYRDAAGPTTHFPINERQVDAWAPVVSETATRFYHRVDGDRLADALA